MTTTQRYNKRDRLGRFVKVATVDEVTTGGTFWNDEADRCHAHPNCGNVVGTATESNEQDGFLCSACVEWTMPAWLASHNVAHSTGTARCRCCDDVRNVTSFPTVVVQSAWRVRGTVCRRCERARRGRSSDHVEVMDAPPVAA